MRITRHASRSSGFLGPPNYPSRTELETDFIRTADTEQSKKVNPMRGEKFPISRKITLSG